MKIKDKSVGDTVTILQGPLAGREATINMKGDHVVVVVKETGDRKVIRGDMEIQ